MSPIIPICELHYMRDYFCRLATGRTTPKKSNLFHRWPSWGNHGDSQGWLSRPLRDGCRGAAVLHFQSDWAPTGHRLGTDWGISRDHLVLPRRKSMLCCSLDSSCLIWYIEVHGVSFLFMTCCSKFHTCSSWLHVTNNGLYNYISQTIFAGFSAVKDGQNHQRIDSYVGLKPQYH